jgi:hypothetical protein
MRRGWSGVGGERLVRSCISRLRRDLPEATAANIAPRHKSALNAPPVLPALKDCLDADGDGASDALQVATNGVGACGLGDAGQLEELDVDASIIFDEENDRTRRHGVEWISPRPFPRVWVMRICLELGRVLVAAFFDMANRRL